MGKRTSYEPGTFSYAELGTTDVTEAKRFYGGLFGWDFDDVPVPDSEPYTVARIEGDSIAGLASMPEQQRDSGVPPYWFSYITVASADETAGRVGELGGNVHAEPFDVMDQGRMAVIADPTGAMFGIWEPRAGIGAERVNDPGSLTWNDLATSDVDAASPFYSELFGWEIEEIDTGAGPRYWTIGHGGGASGRNGGMRELGPAEQGVPPNWMPYFATPSVDDALAKAEELGGGTLMPGTEVPTGKFAAVRDPQGAAFSIVEGEFDD
jgi:predicted enzyme related to lactoylglutathione lyase